jgi:hypothetical protein
MYLMEDVESDSFGMASYDQTFVIGSSKLFWYEFRACDTVLCCRKWRASKTRRMPFLRGGRITKKAERDPSGAFVASIGCIHRQ